MWQFQTETVNVVRGKEGTTKMTPEHLCVVTTCSGTNNISEQVCSCCVTCCEATYQFVCLKSEKSTNRVYCIKMYELCYISSAAIVLTRHVVVIIKSHCSQLLQSTEVT